LKDQGSTRPSPTGYGGQAESRPDRGKDSIQDVPLDEVVNVGGIHAGVGDEFGAVALTLYYVIVTGASIISKVLVTAVLVACLVCIFRLHRYSLFAIFVMTGLGVFITVYRACEQARSSNRPD